jgi:hypothetical protein
LRRAPGWLAPLLALVLVALLVVAVVAATRAGDDDEPRASGEAAATADAAPPNGAERDGDLADTLLAPPMGFSRLADENVGTGPLDADRAPALDGFGGLSPAELTELGLIGGHSRAWQSEDGVLLAIAYEFDDSSGADDFVEQAAAAREADERYRRTPVAEVPEAVVLRSEETGDATTIVLLPAGRRAYVLGLSRTSEDPDDRTAAQLAARQRSAARG